MSPSKETTVRQTPLCDTLWSILTSFAKINKNHPAFIQAQGDKIKSIIDKLGKAGASCNSCPSNTQNLAKPYMKSIDQHLDDLDYMITNFGNKEGFSGTNSLINEMAASGPKADGGAFLMHFIKNNSSDFQNLSRFEFRFNDDLLNRADVLVGNIKYEMKSWSNGGITWNKFFGGTGSSYQQYLSYLQNTNSLDNLKYVFSSSKATEDQVKNAFKGLFSNASKKQEIFDSLTEKIEKQIARTRTEESSPKNTTLYFNLLLETKDLVTALMNLMEEYHSSYKKA